MCVCSSSGGSRDTVTRSRTHYKLATTWRDVRTPLTTSFEFPVTWRNVFLPQVITGVRATPLHPAALAGNFLSIFISWIWPFYFADKIYILNSTIDKNWFYLSRDLLLKCVEFLRNKRCSRTGFYCINIIFLCRYSIYHITAISIYSLCVLGRERAPAIKCVFILPTRRKVIWWIRWIILWRTI